MRQTAGASEQPPSVPPHCPAGVFFMAVRSQSKKNSLALKNILDQAVKVINLIKSCSSRARRFNILRDDMGSMRRALMPHAEIQDGCLNREPAWLIFFFFSQNTIFTGKNDLQNYGY